MIRILLAIVAVVGVVSPSVSGDEVNAPYGQQKVVYHINFDSGADLKRYVIALRNVDNHVKAVGVENLDLRVIFHGPGLNLLIAARENDKLSAAIDSLKQRDVRFYVCNNTLETREIDYQKQLYEISADDIISSGVAELVRLQQQGYIYIKP